MMVLLLGVLMVAANTRSAPLKSAGCSGENLQQFAKVVKNSLGGMVLILVQYFHNPTTPAPIYFASSG